jgi:MFS family permease
LTWGQRQGFGSALALGLFALAAAALLLFLFVETQVDGPILDLRMFMDTSFSLGLLTSTLVFVVVGGTGFIMPFFLELVLRYPIAQVGLLMGISPVLGGIMSPIGGALADRFGPRWVTLAGLTSLAIGCFRLASLDASATTWQFVLSVAPLGLGMGLFSSANNSSVLNAVSRERLGVASALLSLARTLGQSTGVPVVAALFGIFALGHAGSADHETLLGLPPGSLVHGTSWSFVAAGCVALAALLVALWRHGGRARRRPAVVGSPESG